MKARLCLMVAADIEYKAAADVLHKLQAQDHVILLKTGIGAIRLPDRVGVALKDGSFDHVLIAGLCGALDSKLRRGDVVVYDESRSTGASLKLDVTIADRLARVVECTRGPGLSVERVVTLATEKRDLQLAYGAIVVDMETYKIASFCVEHGIAVGVVRVVSDEAHEDLPDFNRALDEHGEMVGWKVAHQMLARPAASLKLVSGFRSTMESFKGAVERVVCELERE
jgi:nucleoside phosphorylase